MVTIAAIFAVFFCSLLTLSPATAAEYILSQEVVDPNAPVDTCPNIPGTQSYIPSGMQLDSGGNCYTPTPVTPVSPVTIDICNNLAGAQTNLPSGYYRTNGNCYQQPSNPTQIVDVCPNLEEVQISVPSSYYLDESNTCVAFPEPVDECPNITGPQTDVPDGMVRENSICYTPATSEPDTDQHNQTAQTESSSLKGIPGFLQPTVLAIMRIIPDSAQKWLQSLPPIFAQTVPYYIFLIVVILALIPILQSIREALFARQISLLLQHERSVAEQKDNFVALASHYLRTPLTLMSGGVDTVVAMNELTAEQVAPLKVELIGFDAKIRSLLEDIDSNEALKTIGAPEQVAAAKPAWRSGWFWGPIIGSLTLTAIANFLLVIVGQKEVGGTHTFFQFVVAAVAFIILYLGVRNLHLQQKLRAEHQVLVDHEKTIDEARNKFISEATLTLRDGLERINATRAVLQNAPSTSYFDEGYGRIESVLQKFLLLSQLQTGVERDLEAIDVHEVVDNLIVTYNSAISAKRLTVTNATSPVFIRQNRLLFNFVLGSVLDNAIKFNQEGGAIAITIESGNKTLTVSITDNGIGINNEKLEQLFKPFSRTTSAVEFNYEGLGFSLFLDKIIMNYTGGDIRVNSQENQGTQLLVATPLL